MVYSKDEYHEIIEINKSSCFNMIKNIINKMLAVKKLQRNVYIMMAFSL